MLRVPVGGCEAVLLFRNVLRNSNRVRTNLPKPGRELFTTVEIHVTPIWLCTEYNNPQLYSPPRAVVKLRLTS